MPYLCLRSWSSSFFPFPVAIFLSFLFFLPSSIPPFYSNLVSIICTSSAISLPAFPSVPLHFIFFQSSSLWVFFFYYFFFRMQQHLSFFFSSFFAFLLLPWSLLFTNYFRLFSPLLPSCFSYPPLLSPPFLASFFSHSLFLSFPLLFRFLLPNFIIVFLPSFLRFQASYLNCLWYFYLSSVSFLLFCPSFFLISFFQIPAI